MSQTALEPRVALISGASRGIGEAIARRLLADGWRVSLGLRNPSDARWAEGDPKVHRSEYDAERGSEPEWIAAAHTAFGAIDAIVANAGVMIPKTVVEAEDADLDLMFSVNVKAPRRLAKAAWPHLVASGRGRVAIIASLSGKRVKSAKSGLYSMSKFAAVALAHALRHTGWAEGVRATAICPGFVDTDMARGLGAPGLTMTAPEEVARLCAMALNLPNSASVAEISINCQDEESF